MIGAGNNLLRLGQFPDVNNMLGNYAQSQPYALYQRCSYYGFQTMNKVMDTRTELRRDLEDYLKDWKE